MSFLKKKESANSRSFVKINQYRALVKPETDKFFLHPNRFFLHPNKKNFIPQMPFMTTG